MSSFQRPMFLADGRVVARRELTLSGHVYAAGDELSPAHRAELNDRQIGMWWSQGLIDTLPVVVAKSQQNQNQQHRR